MLSTVEVLASGTTGDEIMQLEIDGVVQNSWSVSNETEAYVFNTNQTVTGDQVRVRFTNDLWDPVNNVDRNLVVDAIVIDNVRYETESPSVYSTATWKPADGIVPGFRQSETLHANGYFQYADASGPLEGSVIRIQARGSEGDEAMSLEIDDQVVYQVFNVGTNYQPYVYQSADLISIDQLKIRFTNDDSDGATFDRGLEVDWVEIDGDRFETEAPDVWSTGTYVGDVLEPGFHQSEILHANGYFQYGFGPSPGTTDVRIVARGITGNENMALEISGVEVASWNGLGTSLSDYTYQSNSAVDIADIRVRFTNDTYDPDLGIDYNLQVDQVVVDGIVYQTEHPSVYSTGTWLPADGIVPGFRQSEILHSNGYFQFAELGPDPGAIALGDQFYIVSESDGVVSIEVQRLGGTDGVVAIDYETVALTATADVDYASVSGTLQFLEGESSKFVDITIFDDGLTEEFERFSFTIDNPVGGALLLAPRTAVVEITNESNSGNNGPGDPELSVTAEILTQVGGAVAIEWTPDGSKMFIAEFGGFVYVVENGVLESEPFIDISAQVNGVRGLLDVELHPDFENNPYVYLAFVYDPPEVYQHTGLAGPDGSGNRASRLIRVTADVNEGYLKAVPGSEVILLGANSTWENYNPFVDSTVDLDEPPGGINPDGSYVQDFLAADSQTHTIGAVEFGPDGALYVSNGDGASYNAVDPRAIRVQDLDSLSGKILRIDPLTGEGLADNPFYDGDPDSNRSKVYQYGLRNPFRISFDSSGQLYVGDVGWTQWEEINAAPAGANFGWPFYEGGAGGNVPTPYYSDLPEAIAFYASNPAVDSPWVGLNHVDDQIDAVIVGDIYTGDALPSSIQGNLIFNHLASGHVRAVEFDASGNVVEIKTLIQGPAFMTQISVGPDGNLYFVDFGAGQIGRWILN